MKILALWQLGRAFLNEIYITLEREKEKPDGLHAQCTIKDKNPAKYLVNFNISRFYGLCSWAKKC